ARTQNRSLTPVCIPPTPPVTVPFGRGERLGISLRGGTGEGGGGAGVFSRSFFTSRARSSIASVAATPGAWILRSSWSSSFREAISSRSPGSAGGELQADRSMRQGTKGLIGTSRIPLPALLRGDSGRVRENLVADADFPRPDHAREHPAAADHLRAEARAEPVDEDARLAVLGDLERGAADLEPRARGKRLQVDAPRHDILAHLAGREAERIAVLLRHQEHLARAAGFLMGVALD